MEANLREQLLSPSLGQARPTIGLYSARSSLLLAFFFGPVSVVMYSALNSIRLKRPLDAIAYAAATLGFVFMVYAAQMHTKFDALLWINRQIGSEGSMRGLSRLYAILLWCAFYLMHRKAHRSANLFVTAPSPWIPAIACAALGTGAVFAIVFGINLLDIH